MKSTPEGQQIYYPEDIEYDEETGDPFLRIIINQLELILWIKNVNTKEEPVYIAWFDPSREDQQEVGSQVLAELLANRENTIALTPYSGKSGPMISHACSANDIPLFTLLGAKTEEELAEMKKELTNEEKIYEYFPITTDQDHPKQMAITKEMAEQVKEQIKAGKSITIVDDVYSSGATIKEMIKLLQEILGEKLFTQANIEVVTFAREGVIENDQMPKEVDLEVLLKSKVFLPKIIGKLPKLVA